MIKKPKSFPKGKVAIASAVAAAVMVLFPQTGDTVLYMLRTFLDLIPQLTLRPV